MHTKRHCHRQSLLWCCGAWQAVSCLFWQCCACVFEAEATAWVLAWPVLEAEAWLGLNVNDLVCDHAEPLLTWVSNRPATNATHAKIHTRNRWRWGASKVWVKDANWVEVSA